MEFHQISPSLCSLKSSSHLDKYGIFYFNERRIVSLNFSYTYISAFRVEWPGKEHQCSKPKGYVYIIFESEKQIRLLLASCTIQEGNSSTARKYFYKISGKCLKPQKIEVIPWIISDSNYVKSSSQKLDPGKTVFVGALHGQLTAEGLAKIMDELFEGVIYAGMLLNYL